MPGIEGNRIHPKVQEAKANGAKLSVGKHRMTEAQERAVDALVATYGDAMVKVAADRADVFHIEHPGELGWSVNAHGHVGEYSASGPAIYTRSIEEVTQWS